MTQINEFKFKADEGKVFVNKSTNQRFGSAIYLGNNDSITNFFEDDATELDIALENGTLDEYLENHPEYLENNENA